MRINYIVILLLAFTVLVSGHTSEWRLIWDANAPSDSVETYLIYRSEDGSSLELVDSVSHFVNVDDSVGVTWYINPVNSNIDSISWTDNNKGSGLLNDVLYTYRVKARNYNGLESDYSDPASEAIPALSLPDTFSVKADSFLTTSLSSYVSDKDDAYNTLNWELSDPGQFTAEFNESTRELELDAPVQVDVIEKLKITVLDPSGFMDEDSVILKSTSVPPPPPPTNTAPVLSDIDDQERKSGQLFEPINLDNYVQDAQDPDSTLIWNFEGAVDLSLTLSAERVLTIEYEDNWTGSEAILFTVTDPGGLSAADTVRFTILPPDSTETPEVYPFPVPYNPNETGADGIQFADIPEKASIYIFDLIGKPVYKIKDPALPFKWNVANNNGKKVGSGVYIYVVKDENDKKIASGKLIIVR